MSVDLQALRALHQQFDKLRLFTDQFSSMKREHDLLPELLDELTRARALIADIQSRYFIFTHLGEDVTTEALTRHGFDPTWASASAGQQESGGER